MSEVRNSGDMSMFSHVPMRPQWFLQLAAFQSPNGEIVRGAIYMLTNAFYSESCGTIPCTVESVALASQLPVDVVSQYFSELTTGWTINKKRKTMTFEPMANLAKRLDSKFPDALQDMQERAIVAISSPDLISHELLDEQGDALADQLAGNTVEQALSRMEDTGVRRALPENSSMSARMKRYLVEKGFPEETHDDVWEMFYSLHRSENRTSASWEGAFTVWVMNQIRYGKFIPANGSSPAIFNGTQPDRGGGRLPVKTRQARASIIQNRKVEQGEALEENALDNLSAASLAMEQMRRAAQGQKSND